MPFSCIFALPFLVIFLLMSTSSVQSFRVQASEVQASGQDNVVLYAHSEHTPIHKQNGLYFLQFGIHAPNTTIMFIINGNNTIQTDLATAQLTNDNLHILQRENTCFDMGAWSAGLAALSDRAIHTPTTPSSTVYFFINASVRGPLIPRHLMAEGALAWPGYFSKHLSSTTKLVGTTFNPWAGPTTWHLQSMMLVTDAVGLLDVMSSYLNHDPATCHSEYDSAVFAGEIPLSQSFLNKGYGLYALSVLMEGAVVSRENAAQVTATCKRWQPQTVDQLGDPYSTHSMMLLDPYDLIFFKMNRKHEAVGYMHVVSLGMMRDQELMDEIEGCVAKLQAEVEVGVK